MLKRIRLRNFRKFEDFTINLRSSNILVGPNNAGKSALIDSLRLLETALRFAKRRRPRYVRVGDIGYLNEFEMYDASLPISLENVNHNYSENDAVIEYVHENGSKIFMLLHPNRVTRFGLDSEGSRFTTGSAFCRTFPLDLVIVPTIMPLLADEPYVTDETLKKNEGGKLASRHFRNNWLRRSDEEFEVFRNDVSTAWRGVDITRPELADQKITMFFSEDRLDREIHWSGFGFQVWLQIFTHLLRGNEESTVVIDEPDIYLHPDIQKKLVKILGARHKQFVLATHSVEIINDAEGSDIVSINPTKRHGYRLKTSRDFEEIYGYIGSAENADYARIAKVRKVVFFEGNDSKTYQRFARRFGFENLAAGSIPFVKLGGFSQWTRADAAVWAFKELMDIEIDVFAVFDRDFRCQNEVDDFVGKANRDIGHFHVLNVKELENFLLVLPAMHRAILNRGLDEGFDLDRLTELFSRTSEELKHRTFSQRTAFYLEYLQNSGTEKSQATLIEEISIDTEMRWNDLESRVTIVPGKIALAGINASLQEQGIKGLTEAQIVSAMRRNEADAGLIELLDRLNVFCET